MVYFRQERFMTRRRPIDIEHDLPPRPAGLDAEAMTKVFGGCAYRDAGCEWFNGNPKCCPEFTCVSISVNPWRTEKKCVA